MKETLELLRQHGVLRARLTPEGCLLEVEFEPSQGAPLAALLGEPGAPAGGLRDGWDEALDIMGGKRPGEAPQ